MKASNQTEKKKRRKKIWGGAGGVKIFVDLQEFFTNYTIYSINVTTQNLQSTISNDYYLFQFRRIQGILSLILMMNLLSGTLPANNKRLSETLPANNKLLSGTSSSQ